MAQTFTGACDQIMTLLRTLTWIKAAPNDPTASPTQFPFAALFPGTGESELTSGAMKNLHTVNVEIHWTFRDLPRNTADAKDRLDSLLNLLWNDVQLTTTVDTITAIEYDFGPMKWNAFETLGYLLKITFKQRVVLS